MWTERSSILMRLKRRGLTPCFGSMEEAGLCRASDLIETYRKVNRKLWDSYEKGAIDKSRITDTRFASVFGVFGIRADGIETERRYRALLNRTAIVMPGAVELLDYLYGRYDLYVVTNGFTETQKMRMADSGLDRYFIHSFISEEVGFQKPQKEFFDCCFARMEGIKREETLIIGDSLMSDMKGGNAARPLTPAGLIRAAL